MIKPENILVKLEQLEAKQKEMDERQKKIDSDIRQTAKLMEAMRGAFNG